LLQSSAIWGINRIRLCIEEIFAIIARPGSQVTDKQISGQHRTDSKVWIIINAEKAAKKAL
jgi:hypothetical protein